MKGILIIASSLGLPTAHAGRWLRSFDPEAHDGRGHVVTTADPRLAASFPTSAHALEVWRAVPACHPVRASDGKPNRPMTAFTVSIEDLPPDLCSSCGRRAPAGLAEPCCETELARRGLGGYVGRSA